MTIFSGSACTRRCWFSLTDYHKAIGGLALVTRFTLIVLACTLIACGKSDPGYQVSTSGGSCNRAGKSGHQGNHLALLVGISRYKNADITLLPAAESDTR